MANARRIEAKAILRDAQAKGIAESGNVDDGLLRSAGWTDEKIGRLRLKQHEAEQLAQFKAESHGRTVHRD